jgi:hypothetical protein
MEENKENKKIDSKAWYKFTIAIGVIFILAVIGYGILYITSVVDFSFIRGEIIAYPMECSVQTQNGSCPGKTLYALRTTHFKPNYDRQEVVYWIDGISPDLFKNCAVVNRKNWKCEYDDKSATVGFQDGVYFEYPEAGTPDAFLHEYYVSRQTWLQQNCDDSIYAGWLCIPLHRILKMGD